MNNIVKIYIVISIIFMCGISVNLWITFVIFNINQLGIKEMKKSIKLYLTDGHCNLWIYIYICIIQKMGVGIMIEKIAGAMHIFAIIYLITGIITGITWIVAAFNKNSEAVVTIKSLFRSCLFFAILLWILTWLIS